MYTSECIPARLLGAYTLLIAITSTEPLITFVQTGLKPFVNGIIAVCSVMIGPLLFLYCKYRLAGHGWRVREYWHFTPAVFITMIYVGSSFSEESSPKSDSEDIIFYLLFVLQLLSYSFVSLFIVLRKSPNTDLTMRQKLQAAFLKPLVLVSMILFTYSFLHTLIPLFRETFVLTIQLMIGILIVVIALLNAEKLEKHVDVK